MDLQKIFALITSGAAVIAIAGVIYVYLRGSYAEATIKQLKENYDAMKESRNEANIRADKAEARLVVLEERDNAKNDQIRMLQDLVTSRADVEKIGTELNKHHTSAMRKLDASAEKLDAIAKKVGVTAA